MQKYRHISKPEVKPVSSPKMIKVGDILKKRREHNSKTIDQVSNETKISVAKLKALESNNFSAFESTIHASGFIKIYADYLGLDTTKILAVYRRDYKDTTTSEKKNKVKRQDEKNGKFNILQYLVLIVPLLVIVIILSYLYIQYYNFQNPPVLEIIEPKNNNLVQEDEILLIGKTEKDTIVEINSITVSVNDEYLFEKNISLQPGTNIITVKATNIRNTSRESIEILTIEYQENGNDIEVDGGTGGNQTLTLNIENAATWIEIIEDDQLITSEVLPEGYEQEYKPEKNISISTGVIQNTIVQVNGENKVFPSTQYTISCEVIGTKLECE